MIILLVNEVALVLYTIVHCTPSTVYCTVKRGTKVYTEKTPMEKYSNDYTALNLFYNPDCLILIVEYILDIAGAIILYYSTISTR